MASNKWTGNVIDAPYEVIESAIRRILGGAPVPNIHETMVLFNHSWADCPQYSQQYLALQQWYVNEFVESHTRDLNEYGFSEWESPHKLLNTMNKIFNPYHWYHMKHIVADIEQDFRNQERKVGHSVNTKERVEAVAKKAIARRKREYDIELDKCVDSAHRRNTAKFKKSENQWKIINAAMDSRSRTVNTSSTPMEQVSNFYKNNPFWSGVIGALLFYKAKDTFGSK